MSSLINVGGKQVRVRGRLLRIGSLVGDTYVFLEEPEPLLETLRKCGTRIDLFTFLQRLPETSPKYPYPMDWDNFAVLPVTTFDHWLKHQIRFAPRGRVRQAEKKGVSTREVAFDETLVRGIWEIYNECPVRQGTAFAHYGRDIQTVRRLEATFLDKSVFIGAFLGDQMIGFAKLTHDETRTQANLMNIVSMVRHSDKCPTNALIAQAVRSCAERKIAYLVYQKFSYGKKGSDGLSQFKKVNGFERIDLPRYYVPLTPWGRAAIRLRLHQPLADRLPQPMVSKLRDLRSAWYNRKLSNLEAS